MMQGTQVYLSEIVTHEEDRVWAHVWVQQREKSREGEVTQDG